MANQTGNVFKLHRTGDQVEWDNFRNLSRKALGKAKWIQAMENARKYIQSTHEYALMRGDVDTGRRRTMLGREAKAMNDDYQRKFMDSKTPRLYRWKWLRTVQASPDTTSPEGEQCSAP